MQVTIGKNPRRQQGFSIRFPYSASDVDNIKRVLGTHWYKETHTWDSDGPEILMDMQRFGIEVASLSPEAQVIAEQFRQELWDSMDARVMDIEGEQYGFQRQGSHWLASMSAAILGDDLGVGKTKQSLDAAMLVGVEVNAYRRIPTNDSDRVRLETNTPDRYEALRREEVYRARGFRLESVPNQTFRILVLCPKTLLYNWKNEIEKWYPELTVGVVPNHKVDSRKHGPGYTSFWINPPEIVIANYEKLRGDNWPYDFDWQIVIPDEAAKLKNAQTQVYKNVKRIVKRLFAKYPTRNHFWPLTGTPLEIRLVELYNILTLARPAVLGGFYRFKDQHLECDWTGTVIGVRNLNLLRDRIAPYILRRTKREVLPWLPGKVYTNAYVTLSDAERTAYDAFTADFNNWLKQHNVSGGGDPLVQTLRMRQFCCTPKLFTDELGRGSKFEMLEEVLQQHNGKTVIFCFFDEVVQHLRTWLEPHARAFINGSVEAEERIRRVTDFNEGRLGDIFISTDAGNSGINLVGADLIIHYDQLFNPQRMNQREDRLDRIGQTHQVNVINLLCTDTIDMGMYYLNRERENLFRSVVDGAEEAILRKLDAPRWRRLVEGRLNNEDMDLAAQTFAVAVS